MKKMTREVLGVKAPKKECTDKNCPFHSGLVVKKELFKGKLIKKDINHSATIEWNRPFFIPKYERYEVRRSRMRVHNPACVDAQVGQQVLVARTRPISKTKNHVILQTLSDAEEVSTEVPIELPTKKSKKENDEVPVEEPVKQESESKKLEEETNETAEE